MSKEKYQNLLYYNYVSIDEPEVLKYNQRALCEKLRITGRIIIAEEGINGTLEGTEESISKYCDDLKNDERFKDTHFKISESNGNAFPKLKVKVRKEIVSAHLGDEDIDPNQTTGKHITADELHEWYESGKEFYIIDMRNDYEHKVGYFENSLLPSFENFRDLPKLTQEFEHLKDKTILTVCTGGVRCEKASGFLVNKGYKDVHQLYGGIQTYMEKYPNRNFKGKLYVFDGRITIGFNIDSPEHEIVSDCEVCGEKSDNYINCNYKHCPDHTHFICCENCISQEKNYCGEVCKDKAYKEQKFLVEIESINNSV